MNIKKGEPVTPWMYVYKEKIQSDGSLDKLKLRMLVRGDLKSSEVSHFMPVPRNFYEVTNCQKK